MTDSVFHRDNTLTRNNTRKLYLDSEMADVKFVFGVGTDQVDTVPAHKSILSISSSVFRTMFYGSLPEQGDVPIVDASAAAFKEFLQFFYLDTVELTSEHIVDVSIMCHKYGLTEALKLCEYPLQDSFTIDEICMEYALAMLLEISDTIQFCEQMIQRNADKILKSNSFLDSSREMVDKIIQLVKWECNTAMIVDAYISWAKTECRRKNLDETAENLKAQLGPSFDRIPFADLDAEQLVQFIASNSNVLSHSDFTEIIQKVSIKKQLDEQNRLKLIFDRRNPTRSTSYSGVNLNSTFFMVNRTLWLKEIFSAPLKAGADTSKYFRVVISANKKTLLDNLPLAPSSSEEGHVVLKQPIKIVPHVQYKILFFGPPLFTPIKFKKSIRLQDDYEIKFKNNGSVSRLVFQKPDERVNTIDASRCQLMST